MRMVCDVMMSLDLQVIRNRSCLDSSAGVTLKVASGLLDASWVSLGVSWEFPWSLLGASGSLLGASWVSSGCLQGVYWVSPGCQVPPRCFPVVSMCLQMPQMLPDASKLLADSCRFLEYSSWISPRGWSFKISPWFSTPPPWCCPAWFLINVACFMFFLRDSSSMIPPWFFLHDFCSRIPFPWCALLLSQLFLWKSADCGLVLGSYRQTYISIYVYLSIYTSYRNAYMHFYVYMYISVHIYIYIYVCTYMHASMDTSMHMSNADNGR